MLGRQKNYYNYWGGPTTYIYKTPKPQRSIKRKLAIVFSFVFILAIIPSLVYSISNIDFTDSKKVSIVKPETQLPIQKVYPVSVEEAESNRNVNQIEVINNDSYWKISKRACGTGEYYLSIQDQNNAKPLFEGDNVIANCSY